LHSVVGETVMIRSYWKWGSVEGGYGGELLSIDPEGSMGHTRLGRPSHHDLDWELLWKKGLQV